MKVAWEILKALKLRERGPVLIACPTCGRLQFDMDTVVAEIEERLRAYDDPIEVAVLGCAVNGIGEASHADFGITGAKNEGLIFAHGKPIRKVPQERLVDALFAEIDKSIDRGRIVVDEREAAEGAEWLEKIEEENAGRADPRADRGHGGRRGDRGWNGAGAADGRRAEGQADRAGRGGVAHRRAAASRAPSGAGALGPASLVRSAGVLPAAPREHAAERVDHQRVELRAGAAAQLGERLGLRRSARGRGGRWSWRRTRRRRRPRARRAGSRRPRSPSG